MIKALAISPDGRLLAVGEEPGLTLAEQGDIQLWEMARRKKVADFPHVGGIPLTVAFSPNGSTLAAVVTNVKANLQLWDVATHKALPEPIPRRNPIWTLAYSPDGRILAVGTFLTSYGPGGRPLPVAPDGRFLAGASAGGTIQMWQAPAGVPYRPISLTDFGPTVPAPPMAFSPHGQYLHASPGVGEIIRYNHNDDPVGPGRPPAFAGSPGRGPDGVQPRREDPGGRRHGRLCGRA